MTPLERKIRWWLIEDPLDWLYAAGVVGLILVFLNLLGD